jgi:WD40 repeat protein
MRPAVWVCVSFLLTLVAGAAPPEKKEGPAHLLHVFAAGKSAVTAVAISPNGKRGVAGTKDGAIIVLDLEENKELRRASGPSSEVTGLRRLEGHRDAVDAMIFTLDSRRLYTAAGGVDHTMRVWDVTLGKELLQKLYTKKGKVYSSAVSFDCRHVATGHASDVKLWETRSGNELAKFDGHTSTVGSVAFARDNRSLVTGGKDKTVRVWDIAMTKQRRVFEGHKEAVTGVAFAPDMRRVLSASADRTVRIWDIVTGKTIATLESHTDDALCIACSPDGKFALSGGADKTVRYWQLPK